MPVPPFHTNSESTIPCFTATFDKEGGLTTSGSISLLVPPFSVSEATQFSSHMLLEPTGIPALSMPDGHYPLSPILSFSPHDAKFPQKVTICFPSSAVSKDWLLRLMHCPLNGDRWEALVDVLVPHDMSSSNVIIMSRDGTLYAPGINSILVDHFCYKCWVGVPSRPTAKKQILCALFGRSLGASWEVIVRCFSPYVEVYRSICETMQDYGAERLIECPELLEIGESGSVRIAFESCNSLWQLDEGSPEFLAPAKSTFWDVESPLGYRHKFIISPEKDTGYVRAVVSVSYIDTKRRESRSIRLDGSAPIRDRSPGVRTKSERSHCNVFHITHCSDMIFGSYNYLLDKRTTTLAPAPVPLPPTSHGLAGNTTSAEKGKGCQDYCGFVSPSSSVDKANLVDSKRTAMPSYSCPTVKCCQPDVAECGQQVYAT